MHEHEGDLERLARKQQQNRQRPRPAILPPPSAPMAVAREFVETCCLFNGSPEALTVRYWCGSWWTWRTTHWAEAEERTVRSLLYHFTEHAI
jgi:hypothetical protein